MGKRRDWLIWPVLSETDACNLLLVVVDPSSGLPKNNVFSYFANFIFLFVFFLICFIILVIIQYDSLIQHFHILLICSGVLPSVAAPIVSSKKTQFSGDKIFLWIVHLERKGRILNSILKQFASEVFWFWLSLASKCAIQRSRSINKTSC